MNKDNKKGKFNAIDALIILLLIVCIGSVLFRVFDLNEQTVDAQLREYKVQVKIDSLSTAAIPYLQKGDVIRLKDSNEVIGTFEGLKQVVAAVGAYNDEGEKVFYPEISESTIYDDSRCLVSCLITVMGERTENGLLLNGDTYITSNSELVIITENIETVVRIVSIGE